MKMSELVLEGIEGSSPLGFLAALGILVVLDDKWPGLVYLSWVKASGYRPLVRFPGLHGKPALGERQASLAEFVADAIRVPAPVISQSSSRELERLFKAFLAASNDLNEREKSFRKRHGELKQHARKQGLQGDALRSWIGEQTADLKAEINERRDQVQKVRERWLDELGRIVPAQELRLGKKLSIKPVEYRDAAIVALKSWGNLHSQREVDFLAAFAAESVVDRELVETTPFSFVSGSGHQYFLETVWKLMQAVDARRIEKCLFYPWTFEDERLSLRWAPVEDRRYALMWDDPGGQEVSTVWAANLLGYNGLRLLPVADVGGRLGVSGFTEFGKRQFFSWPIWQGFLSINTVRSLLSLDALRQLAPEHARLERMGVLEVFRSEKLRVGKPPLVKFNFAIPFPAGTGEKVSL